MHSIFTLLELILCPQGKKKAPMYVANLEKTAHIQALRDEWTCMRSEAACGSTYCYVDPGSGDHIPLSHEAIDTWAMGMVSVFSLTCAQTNVICVCISSILTAL